MGNDDIDGDVGEGISVPFLPITTGACDLFFEDAEAPPGRVPLTPPRKRLMRLDVLPSEDLSFPSLRRADISVFPLSPFDPTPFAFRSRVLFLFKSFKLFFERKRSEVGDKSSANQTDENVPCPSR